MAAIIATAEVSTSGLRVTYRTAGDRGVLIEYGQQFPVDLGLNFFVHAAARHLDQHPVRGILEVVPGLRSLLVHYDPSTIGQAGVVAAMDECHEDIPEPDSLVLPSRRLRLPIAFDDSTSREAVNRYRISSRPEAPNVLDGNNIDYIVACNGLPDRESFYATVLETEWWNAFTGFYPGLPSLLPLDPRSEVFAPKYNPARSWTPEGAVALGGPCLVIHPIESAGSYQIFGRTLPISALTRRPRAHRIDPILIYPCDRISFSRVSEAELVELRRQVFEGRYDYDIEPGEYAVAEHCSAVRDEQVAAEAERRRAARQAAHGLVKIP
ncbi:carboxyltransferase domain-containing protein [Saccharopolyspora oryzae]|uniref:Carboxyltransferase domain-containing protein n=1 Tax=Saccharopolyspora oryzae TaxID=2997343 RepID=A0ABT4UUB3_9PSEU|nr:carboxyltransferase domain-containing protein [Saccharopolyspora oryzae]MDA3624669.1 carboxyltransferase domain-containing protein [Saccharopolyspora oryzae]